MIYISGKFGNSQLEYSLVSLKCIVKVSGKYTVKYYTTS